MKKAFLFLLSLATVMSGLLAISAFQPTAVPRGNTYQCVAPGGCDARYTEGGEIKSTHFRSGDISGPEHGYWGPDFTLDNGWVKVVNQPPKPEPPAPTKKERKWWNPWSWF